MKRPYGRPQLIEYGRIDQLTLGSGGTKPDYVLIGTNLINVNDDCDASPPATGCLIVGSG